MPFRLTPFALAAAFLIAACSRSGPDLPPPPVVDAATNRTVAQGTLVGFSHHEQATHVWRALPFAAPPVGELRWRAPRPAAEWSGVRESLDQATWCPQIRGRLDDGSSADAVPLGSVMGGEDCLYMDIYAPAMSADEAAKANLPVMMWIHGGSNVWGRAQQYDPAALAAKHGLIIAVMQYRLGPLGWFAHDAIAADAETEMDASANFATLDQIAALEWLRDNAAAFGGDAGNVTIFGESAGGHNVATLLTSPPAKGLFHRAIIQSGSFNSNTLEEAKTRGNQASTPITAELFPEADTVTADMLRNVPLDRLFAAYMSDAVDGLEPPRIIEDGLVVPFGGPREAVKSAETFNAVPVITGTNKDELKLFNILNPELVRWRFGRIPRARDEAVYEAASSYQSRMWRAGAVDAAADAMLAGGHDEVYAYRFDWDEGGKVWGADFSKLFGAAHSLEIPFVFGQFRFLGDADRFIFTEKNEAGRVTLSDQMMSYWAQFARTGEPGRGVDGTLPAWSTWSTADDAPKIMLLDSPADGGVRMDADGETPSGIITDLFEDDTISDDVRCRIYAGLDWWNPEKSAGPTGGCA